MTRRRGIPLHVDCCLGGFVLPFARELGHPVPPFDFSVPGVTSISADTHKFGQAHKGTSVVLYRSQALRRHQYTSVTDWTGGEPAPPLGAAALRLPLCPGVAAPLCPGDAVRLTLRLPLSRPQPTVAGLYISPGFAGSRSGALIATAWASLAHLGRDGFLAATAGLMAVARTFAEGVGAIPGLEVMGSPEMCVVAFRASPGSKAAPPLNIYQVNDLMSRRGWHLSALQRPAALHICFTAAHGPAAVAALLQDLAACCAAAAADPAAGGGGMAPLYGMAAVVPDRRVVGNFLVAYQDILLQAQ